MAAAGVKKNFTKFQVLITIIPKKVQDEVKSIIRRKETDFPDKNAYKILKDEILRIFGPRPQDAVDRALGRVLVGQPSSLARALVADLCKKELRGCECCPAIVLALWLRHLSSQVRAGIAHMAFNANTFKDITELADKIHASNNAGGGQVNAYSVAAVSAPLSPPNLDETQAAIPYPIPEVAAIQRGGRGGRGRWNRGGRNNRGGRGGRGNSSSSGSSSQQSGGPRVYKGTKHPDLPAGDWTGCNLHYKFGRGANFCAEPATCPWKNIYTPKQ